MRRQGQSPCPTVLLRISDGTSYMHREFNDFAQAVRSGEAFAGAGFVGDDGLGDGPIPAEIRAPDGEGRLGIGRPCTVFFRGSWI